MISLFPDSDPPPTEREPDPILELRIECLALRSRIEALEHDRADMAEHFDDAIDEIHEHVSAWTRTGAAVVLGAVVAVAIVGAALR